MKALVLFVVVAVFMVLAPEKVSAQIHPNQEFCDASGCITYAEAVNIASARRIQRMGYDSYAGDMLWHSWPQRQFSNYGQLYQYPYDYSYGGTSYRGSWGRVHGRRFSVVAMPCRELSGRQRTQKFAAKVLIGAVGGAVLDRNRGRGALLGGAAGTAWALADDSEYCTPSQQMMIPVDPRVQQREGPPFQSEQEEATRPTSTTTSTGLQLKNEADEAALIYDEDQFISRLLPRTSMSVGKPAKGYRAIVEKFNDDGSVSQWQLGRQAKGTTLVFTSGGSQKLN